MGNCGDGGASGGPGSEGAALRKVSLVMRERETGSRADIWVVKVIASSRAMARERLASVGLLFISLGPERVGRGFILGESRVRWTEYIV